MRYHNFTPTQRRMLKVLADGRPHSRQELLACLPDELGSLATVRVHLTLMRRKLRDHGQDIVCVLSRGTLCYQQILQLPELLLTGTAWDG